MVKGGVTEVRQNTALRSFRYREWTQHRLTTTELKLKSKDCWSYPRKDTALVEERAMKIKEGKNFVGNTFNSLKN